MQPDIATIGDNCIDRYLPPIGLSTIGGNALNVAVQLRRCGRGVAYFGAVGEDIAGRLTVARLTENGVDAEGVVARARPTAYTELTRNADGERVIGFEEFGACRGYRPRPADLARLKRMRHVHLGWLDDGGACKRELAAAGISVSQDLAVNPGGDLLAVAFASAGPDPARAEALLRQALAEGAKLAVVTMGPAGSVASDGSMRAQAQAGPAKVLDTLGAGDSFAAAFLDAYLKSAPLQQCLQAGSAAAARTCEHWGGFPQPVLTNADL